MNQVLAYCFIVILLAVAGGSFYAGYQQSRGPDLQQANRRDLAEQKERISALESQLRAMQIEQSTRTYAPAEPAPRQEPVSEHALRAAQETQVFTDRKGRELVATIVKVGLNSSQVKRVSDDRYFELDHSYLNAEDREFMRYLYNQNPDNQQQRAEDAIDWDAIFK